MPPPPTNAGTSDGPTASSALLSSPPEGDATNANDETLNGDDEDVEADEDGDDVDPSPARANPGSADPYAGLESAFGGYLADQPRPIGRSGTPDESDALF